MEKKNFYFDAFVKQAGKQIRSGQPLVGAEGIFTPLLKRVIEASLESELDQHLKETKKVDTTGAMGIRKKYSKLVGRL